MPFHFSPRQIATGVGVYFAAAVGGYLYLRTAKAPAPSPCGCGRHGSSSQAGEGDAAAGDSSSQAADGRATFDRLADAYDSLIAVDETFMGLKLMRRWLMRHAEGDVLEVSAGTGRNLPYYPLSRMRSLTLTDTSRPMLINAADKYAAMVDKGDAPAATPVRFELADAQQLVGKAGAGAAGSSGGTGSSGGSGRGSRSAAAGGGEAEAPAMPRQQGEGAAAAAAVAPAVVHRPPLKEQRRFAPRSFDVVVDTFGLCSQEDPVTALKEMARVCKPGGRILLLQHGKGSWDFINTVLDKDAGDHFLKWGCWWNRDIAKLVRQAGLEVESQSRWHFGTTYYIVARPPADGSL